MAHFHAIWSRYVTEQFGETDFYFFDKRLGDIKSGSRCKIGWFAVCSLPSVRNQSEQRRTQTGRGTRALKEKKCRLFQWVADMDIIKRPVKMSYDAMRWKRTAMLLFFPQEFTYGSYCSLKVKVKFIIQFILMTVPIILCKYFKEKLTLSHDCASAQCDTSEVSSKRAHYLSSSSQLQARLSSQT